MYLLHAGLSFDGPPSIISDDSHSSTLQRSRGGPSWDVLQDLMDGEKLSSFAVPGAAHAVGVLLSPWERFVNVIYLSACPQGCTLAALTSILHNLALRG